MHKHRSVEWSVQPLSPTNPKPLYLNQSVATGGGITIRSLKQGTPTYKRAKMSNAWNLDNPAFSTFVFYSGVLALKMVIMSPLTGYFRVSRGAFPNPEDAKSFGQKSAKTDPDVERARRAHQNDLENIPIFIMAASMYLLTDPCPNTAKMLFRVFAFSRILHTFFYLRSSSIRPLFYLAPLFINVYMAGCVVYAFW